MGGFSLALEQLSEGLPQKDAELTILRQAFGSDRCDPFGLFFGSTPGEVFGAADGGGSPGTQRSSTYLPCLVPGRALIRGPLRWLR